MNYKAELIKMIENVKSEGVIEYLYTFIRLFFGEMGLKNELQKRNHKIA